MVNVSRLEKQVFERNMNVGNVVLNWERENVYRIIRVQINPTGYEYMNINI